MMQWSGMFRQVDPVRVETKRILGEGRWHVKTINFWRQRPLGFCDNARSVMVEEHTLLKGGDSV